MADNRDDLTKAVGITADLVMELGTYYSAQDMRKMQTGLTSAARELRALTQTSTLLGRLGGKLSSEQRELLLNTASLLDSIKYNVEHAKEIKAREEKAQAKQRQRWARDAEQLVETHFALPMGSVSEQVKVLEIYLVYRAILGHTSYLKDNMALRRMMQDEPPSYAKQTLAQWRQNEATRLLSDLRSAIRDYISWDLKTPPAQRLADAQRSLEDRRSEVLAQPQSVDIIRIWTEALKGAAFITSAMTSKIPSR